VAAESIFCLLLKKGSFNMAQKSEMFPCQQSLIHRPLELVIFTDQDQTLTVLINTPKCLASKTFKCSCLNYGRCAICSSREGLGLGLSDCSG
jgi:hypothetical protein